MGIFYILTSASARQKNCSRTPRCGVFYIRTCVSVHMIHVVAVFVLSRHNSPASTGMRIVAKYPGVTQRPWASIFGYVRLWLRG